MECDVRGDLDVGKDYFLAALTGVEKGWNVSGGIPTSHGSGSEEDGAP